MEIKTADTNKTINILLVEDDDGDARAVERAFKECKIINPITRAFDGVEAMDILKGTNGKEKLNTPYILLVDLNMPRMGGLEFVEQLRKDSELKQAVIFMLTTSKREEDKIDAYNLNVAGYIVKETAGKDFMKLIELIDSYWRIVELP
jgi:CheY-like chemotaxis protein